MAKRIDPEDLVGYIEIGALLDEDPKTVRVWKGRYGDFPLPLVVRSGCNLWLKQDILKWHRTRS